MAFEVATGVLTVDTGIVGTTYAVTGLTFQPKAVIFWWSGRSDTVNASGEQDIKPGIGFAVSSTSRRAVTGQSDHGPATTATDAYHTDAACVATLDIAGAVDGLADLQSFDSGGFTLVIDDAFSAALRVSFLALGGADLTNAEIGTLQLAVATGNSDYTSLTSFQPDAGIFISSTTTVAAPSANTTSHISVGAATASQQAVLVINSFNNAATSVAGSYCRSGEIYASLRRDLGNCDQRASFTSFLSTGFRINKIESAVQPYIHFLALKGGQYNLGSFLTATDLNNFTETVGFTPTGAVFFSANRAEDSADTVAGHAEWSVGAAASASSRTAQYVRDKDASGNADCFSAIYHDELYINASNDATQVIEGLCDLVSFGSDMTLVMDDADPAQSFVWYLAFGSTATPVSQSVTSRYEALQGVAQSKLSLWEAAGIVSQNVVSPWESAGVVARALTSLYESLVSVSQSKGSPWESLAQVIASAQTPYEALMLVAVAKSTAWESSGVVAREIASPWESAGLVSREITSLWESLLGLIGCASIREELLSQAGLNETLLGEAVIEQTSPFEATLSEDLMGEAGIGESLAYEADSTVALCKG